MSENKDKDKRTASQKLADAEQAILQLFQVFDRFGRDLSTAKDALKLLNNKVDAIVKASSNGEQLTDVVIERIMVENNVAELSGKVDGMVQQGIVVAEETVSENAFIVGAEYDENGTLVNPRLQFALKALAQELQAKLLGTKVGDLLTLQEGKLKFKVLESYEIQGPKLEEAPPAPTEAPAPEAEAAPVEVTDGAAAVNQ